jgi:hypothetical protein
MNKILARRRLAHPIDVGGGIFENLLWDVPADYCTFYATKL